MSLVRALLPASLTALLALAIAAPSPASATGLCEEAAGSGTCENPYPRETPLKAEATNTLFKTSLGNITCKKSTLEGETTSDGGEAGVAVGAKISALSFGSCEVSGTACTITAANLVYKSSIGWTSGNNGSAKIEKGGAGEPGAAVKCGALINCTLSGEPSLSINGGEAGKATIGIGEAKVKGSGGGFCPETATWSATYTVTSPTTSLYVSQATLWLRANPATWDFGKVTVGQSAAKTITIRYVGGGGTMLLSAFIENTLGVAFSIAANPAETCSTGMINHGQTCTVTVKFEPESTGSKTARMAIDENVGLPRHFEMSVKGEGK